MSLTSSGSKEVLSESQRTALISLLADEDPSVYHTVRAKILSYGQPAREWLHSYTLHPNAVLRRRVQEILTVLGRQTADNEFLGFCLRQGEEFDVEQGVWLLARTQYPDLNVAAYQALFDSYASELRQEINLQGDPAETLAAINQYLFENLGFKGNEENYYDPQNSYLNQVMDRRTGNPISLCLVYLFLSRRLKLPMTGIGLPGHFICRYQSSKNEIFIDAFNKGKLLTKGDCIKYLLTTNHSLQEGHLAPVSARRMLLRICANLHQIYAQMETSDEIARLQRYLVALAK